MIFGCLECCICHGVADPACVLDHYIVCEDCEQEINVSVLNMFKTEYYAVYLSKLDKSINLVRNRLNEVKK